MKQYMLSVHDTDADTRAPELTQQMHVDVGKLNEEMVQAGAWVFAGGLTAAADATVVRVEKGEVTLTDGTYGEIKEQVGGLWVIKAENLDEALAWAEKATKACLAAIEVRAFEDEPED